MKVAVVGALSVLLVFLDVEGQMLTACIDQCPEFNVEHAW